MRPAKQPAGAHLSLHPIQLFLPLFLGRLVQFCHSISLFSISITQRIDRYPQLHIVLLKISLSTQNSNTAKITNKTDPCCRIAVSNNQFSPKYRDRVPKLDVFQANVLSFIGVLVDCSLWDENALQNETLRHSESAFSLFLHFPIPTRCSERAVPSGLSFRL